MVDDSVSVIQINAGHTFATRCIKTNNVVLLRILPFLVGESQGMERRWPKVQAGVPDSLSLPGGGDPLDWDPHFFSRIAPSNT